jgi:hypothetical protein
MPVKLIAVDMDGTFLNVQNTYIGKDIGNSMLTCGLTILNFLLPAGITYSFHEFPQARRLTGGPDKGYFILGLLYHS